MNFVSQPKEGRHSMKKVDLENMDFCPPRKWLAVHKDGISTMDVDDIDKVTKTVSGWATLKGDLTTTDVFTTWKFSECHLCGFTGYYDVDDEIYGGHIIRTRYRNKAAYGIVYWAGTEWYLRPISENWRGIRPLWKINPKEIIGHIHIKDSWSKILSKTLKNEGSDSEVPEEVRRLLE